MGIIVPGEGTTLKELRDFVRQRLDDFALPYRHTETGDGNWTQVSLPHYPVVAESVSVTVDDVAETVTAALDSGIVTFSSAPADQAVVLFAYSAYRFSDSEVNEAIGGAVDELYPHFYVTDLDTTLSTTSGTYEYTLPACEVVTGVEFRASASEPWMSVKARRYAVVRHGTTKYLKLHDDPGSGSLRLSLVTRPASFAADGDAIEDIGLPGRACGPIISYACWRLLNDKLAARVQSNAAVAVQEQGAATVLDYQRTINLFRIQFESELALKQMHPWSAR